MKNNYLYFLLVAICFFGSQSNGQDILPTQSREDAQAIIDRIQDLENQPHHPYSPEPISSVAAKVLFYQLDPASYGKAAKQLIKRDDKETVVDFDIIQAWARRDPKAAFEFIEEVKPGWLDCSFCYELC